MDVLVLGGYGAVGAHVVARLRAAGDTAHPAGRDPRRAERVLDLDDPDLTGYRAALDGVDAVVNASGAENPCLAETAGAAGCAFVDIGATASYLARLAPAGAMTPVVVDVGLAPGLTNLLAAELHARVGGPIELAVLLGAGERHGAAATDWTYRLLGRRFADGADTVRNYTRPRVFELPGIGRRRMYRVDFSDQHTLTRDLGVPVRTYFGLDSRPATAALALSTWVPGASKGPRGLRFPGGDEWLVLARAADGTTKWARGRGQSAATGLIAAAAVRAAGRLTPGVHPLHRVLRLSDLAADHGIEFAE